MKILINISLFLLFTTIVNCQSKLEQKEIVKPIEDVKEVVKKDNYCLDKDDSIPIFLPNHSYPNIDGSQFDFSQVKGKVLLLDFWSTRCAPCIKAYPKLEELHKRVNSPNFVVITISTDNDIIRWKEFLKKNKWESINIYAGNNPENPLNGLVQKPTKKKVNGKILYVSSLPSYFLITKDLDIVKIDNISDKEFENRIKKLLL